MQSEKELRNKFIDKTKTELRAMGSNIEFTIKLVNETRDLFNKKFNEKVLKDYCKQIVEESETNPYLPFHS